MVSASYIIISQLYNFLEYWSQVYGMLLISGNLISN